MSAHLKEFLHAEKTDSPRRHSFRGYDPERRQLDIEFDTHRIMRYEDVGQEVADRFLTSAAPASYFADEIDGEYPAHDVKFQRSPQCFSGSPAKKVSPKN